LLAILEDDLLREHAIGRDEIMQWQETSTHAQTTSRCELVYVHGPAVMDSVGFSCFRPHHIEMAVKAVLFALDGAEVLHQQS
jgi:hypothetical protein